MGVLVRELAALYAAFVARRAATRCPSCRSSTPTTRSGSASWLRGRGAGAASSPTGGSGWPARRRCWSCRPTGRARPVQQLPRRAGGRSSWPRAARPAVCRRWRRRAGATLVHGAAGGRSRRCSSRYSGPGRRGRRHADRRPQPRGDRGADRLLRQHAGAARGPRRATPASASCSAGCARRRWTPTRTRTCRSSSWSKSCAAERSLSHAPLFQVMFALQNAPALERLGAARPRGWSRDGRGRPATAKFDLTL